jgi:hypothetical protein
MSGCMSVVIGRRGVSGLVALLLVGVCLMSASTARAGEWVQRSCSYGTEYIPTESWEGIEVNGYKNPNQDRPFDGCLGFTMGGGLDVGAAADNGDEPGAGEMWLYRAPHESTIASGLLTATLTAHNGDAQIVASAKNGPATLANCESPNCHSGGGLVPITASGGTELYEQASCFGTDGGPCPSEPGFAAEAGISSAQIVLATNATPGGSGFSGTLLSEMVSGKGRLSFTATDPGPGVYQVIVRIDSQQMWAATPSLNEGKCVVKGAYEGARAFNYAQPCPTSIPVSAEIDTSSLADGPHHLTVEVEDAAGDTSVVYAGTVSIDNQSTVGAAGSGPANGTNASDQAKLTARWKSTSKVTRTSRYGQADSVTGRLTTSTGQPISGALLDVSATPADEGAKSASLASVRTGPTGAWALTLPKGISSSALHFTYRSHVDDTIPVATTVLILRVHAGIVLRIAPHVTSVGHMIHFSGVLHGAPIPPGGKQLVLEASSGREWVQFDTITTDAKGRYRASYRFKFPGPAAYRFRVYVPHEADFPFLEGTSNIVGVYER